MMKKTPRTSVRGVVLTVIMVVCFIVFDSLTIEVSADRQLLGDENLSIGMVSDQVDELQMLLVNKGFLDSISDKGKFTKEVQQAVIAFQQTSLIQQDGIAGPQTLGALQVLKLGDNGRVVTYLQSKLDTLGYYNGPIDGHFEELTHKAVKHFQDDYELQVDGIAGPKTYGALHTALQQPENRTITSRSNQQEEKQTQSHGTTIQMEATAYTAYCDGCSGITYTGLDLRSNPAKKVIAVDPQVIPLGSKVYVEGYGEAIAADIGGAIKGNRIDIFIPNKDDALKFGRQMVDVTIKN
ncbi:peptidoglycan-binding protein [Salipaludibacillus agaradhaerens]|uniref:Peptidoglycan-binding protein n=1 Tax=Salipaludibacillus agaradhaerens TaxID=76935 RepID=A0A9Q4B1N2_SALAG|nr:peptidoglycan-binding protein [Salipaludibacillus agaradhaerens]MCR6096385.1 peptidoglycan-binding protein [Salipaludibacillus agaradhaerens]MCR6114056.1 peptidoglycan-binding protein [Salipaludibacillus agaradhaerens]